MSRVVFLPLFLGLFTHAKSVQILGNPSAPIGGTLYMNVAVEPDVLNPISTSEAAAHFVSNQVVEGLLFHNPETNEFETGLADKFDVSKDGRKFTFRLRKDATFSDGTPVTSADVRFSIEAIRDPAYKAVARVSYFDNLERIETPNARTIRIYMKKRYFKNLEVFASNGFLPIVPKAVYGDPAKANAKVLIGSGPYKLDKLENGKGLELVRNPNWWGYKSKDSRFTGMGKFDRIVYRFVRDPNLQLEMLKKGELDFLDFVQPDVFVQKAVGEPFDTKIIKHKEDNQDPTHKSFNFIAWNLRNPLFQSRNVRMALAHLMNREEMNEKFRFNMSDLAAGPTWLRNEYVADSAVKPIPYDPAKAATLLKKSGWTDKAKKGVISREVNGKRTPFKFTLLLPTRDNEKYFTVYKEELRKAGIEMEIKHVEWSSFIKLLDDQKFDAVTMSWIPGSLEQDLKQIWHSTSNKPGGSNFINYANPEVDKTIDKAREELNTKKRRMLWRKAYRLIADDAPYAFMFSTRYDLYFVWDHIGMTKGTMKFDRGSSYWWRTAP